MMIYGNPHGVVTMRHHEALTLAQEHPGELIIYRVLMKSDPQKLWGYGMLVSSKDGSITGQRLTLLDEPSDG